MFFYDSDDDLPLTPPNSPDTSRTSEVEEHEISNHITGTYNIKIDIQDVVSILLADNMIERTLVTTLVSSVPESLITTSLRRVFTHDRIDIECNIPDEQVIDDFIEVFSQSIVPIPVSIQTKVRMMYKTLPDDRKVAAWQVIQRMGRNMSNRALAEASECTVGLNYAHTSSYDEDE